MAAKKAAAKKKPKAITTITISSGGSLKNTDAGQLSATASADNGTTRRGK